MPCLRHSSRSPLMALAVSATIGKDPSQPIAPLASGDPGRECGVDGVGDVEGGGSGESRPERIARVAAYPSISGICTSIRITSGRRWDGGLSELSSDVGGSLIEFLRNSRHSRPLQTAETVKLSFLMSRIAICWLISSTIFVGWLRERERERKLTVVNDEHMALTPRFHVGRELRAQAKVRFVGRDSALGWGRGRQLLVLLGAVGGPIVSNNLDRRVRLKPFGDRVEVGLQQVVPGFLEGQREIGTGPLSGGRGQPNVTVH